MTKPIILSYVLALLFASSQTSFLKSESQAQIKGLQQTTPKKKSQLKIGLQKTLSNIGYTDKRPFAKLAKTKTVQRTNGATAEISLKNKDNFDYLGEFFVGSQKQPMRGCFDTGSANAWILSSECDTDKCINSKDLELNYFFNPDVSDTYEELGNQATIQFGSGTLAGHFGKDSFTIGSGSDSEIAITAQTMGLVTQMDFMDPSYDAIIGLAYPAMSDTGLPIFDSMIQQGLLSQNIFSFYMAMNRQDSSELLFGSYDTDKFVGDINWHPVIDKLFWSLKLDDIKYNGQSLELCQDKECLITPDSGTSLITSPGWAISKIQNFLPYVEGCENDLDYGTLVFVIDGKDYSIPSHHYMERYYNVYEEGDSVCMTSITQLDIYQPGQENLFILGDVFMQIYYTIFDRDNDQVGLAEAKIRNDEEKHDFDLAQQGNIEDFM